MVYLISAQLFCYGRMGSKQSLAGPIYTYQKRSVAVTADTESKGSQASATHSQIQLTSTPERECACMQCMGVGEKDPWFAERYRSLVPKLLSRQNSELSANTSKWWQVGVQGFGSIMGQSCSLIEEVGSGTTLLEIEGVGRCGVLFNNLVVLEFAVLYLLGEVVGLWNITYLRMWFSTCAVVFHLRCGIPPALWFSTCAVLFHLRCGILPALWYSTCAVVFYLRCGIPPALWYSTCAVVFHLRCGIPPALWYSTCAVVFYLRCAIPPALWYSTCAVVFHLCCGFLPALCYSTWAVVFYLRSGIVPALWFSTCPVVFYLRCGFPPALWFSTCAVVFYLPCGFPPALWFSTCPRLQADRNKVNYTKVVDILLSLFPDEDHYSDAGPHRCRTCAVVGNSGNLIGSHLLSLGMNKGPTKGYEKDVGTKTTHRAIYPESATDLDNSTHLVLVPFKILDLQWLISIFTTKHITRSALCLLLKVMILHPEFIKYVYESWLKKQGAYPSTGFIMLVLSLHICDQVNVFGFGATEGGDWHHYYEKRYHHHLNKGKHRGGAEYNITLTLLSKHKIQMFKGW
ncbi:hypothetical protein NFI96_016842 [Prochilodus magdalenae]|nr:hypothetical protein NFI96_016842 [Prochilodus magdalenae]